jgi:hypothetical protein
MVSRVTLLACAALLIVGGGCHLDTAPLDPAPSKLLVTNTTCESGACTAFRVLAFPENQPNTPGGYWSLDLGTISAASACLTIPASATFKITDASTGVTTTLTWTTAKNVSIGLLTPSQSTIMASPSTGTFVPAKAAGWGVALPGNATPTPAAPCQ